MKYYIKYFGKDIKEQNLHGSHLNILIVHLWIKLKNLKKIQKQNYVFFFIF